MHRHRRSASQGKLSHPPFQFQTLSPKLGAPSAVTVPWRAFRASIRNRYQFEPLLSDWRCRVLCTAMLSTSGEGTVHYDAQLLSEPSFHPLVLTEKITSWQVMRDSRPKSLLANLARPFGPGAER